MTYRVLTPDRVLLVKGPMKVEVQNEASILGKDVSNSKITCSEGRVWPIETESGCQVFLSHLEWGQNIPGDFWIQARQEAGTKIWEDIISSVFRCAGVNSKSILLLGPTDSGKTTLSTYIINQAIKRELRPAIIDADIGQGDLAPPGTIGCAPIENQILDLREVKGKHFRFIGSTNPTRNERLILRSVESLIREVNRENSDFRGIDLVVVNTDGYVAGEGLYCKIAIANAAQPDTVVCLGENAPDFCKQLRSSIQLGKLPLMLSPKAKLALSYRPIIKLRSERERRRAEQFQRYMTSCGKEFGTKGFSLRKIRFVHKGLIYHSTFFRVGDHITLLRKNRARIIANAALANMFVGLGRASTIIGFGVISSIKKKEITIRTNFADIDTIYLSNIGINLQTWKQYKIKNDRKLRSSDFQIQGQWRRELIKKTQE
jgi:polynucleotide 5'-hydroxyl-kinase GRC3/NOL9